MMKLWLGRPIEFQKLALRLVLCQ